jgi:hypothetical protein
MSLLINQPIMSAADSSAQVAMKEVPPALLLLVPQIKAATGNEHIALATIKSAWDGTLTLFEFGQIIPLADAIQRCQVVFDASLRAYFKRVSILSPGKEGMKMRLISRIAFRVSTVYCVTSRIDLNVMSAIYNFNYSPFFLLSAPNRS